MFRLTSILIVRHNNHKNWQKSDGKNANIFMNTFVILTYLSAPDYYVYILNFLGSLCPKLLLITAPLYKMTIYGICGIQTHFLLSLYFRYKTSSLRVGIGFESGFPLSVLWPPNSQKNDTHNKLSVTSRWKKKYLPCASLLKHSRPIPGAHKRYLRN